MANVARKRDDPQFATKQNCVRQCWVVSIISILKCRADPPFRDSLSFQNSACLLINLSALTWIYVIKGRSAGFNQNSTPSN
jgi:hypothetical protein